MDRFWRELTLRRMEKSFPRLKTVKSVLLRATKTPTENSQSFWCEEPEERGGGGCGGGGVTTAGKSGGIPEKVFPSSQKILILEIPEILNYSVFVSILCFQIIMSVHNNKQ